MVAKKNRTRPGFELPKTKPDFFKMKVPAPEGKITFNDKHDDPEERVEYIAVKNILPSPHQERKINPNDPKLVELANNIKKNKLLQPIVVTPNIDPGSNDKYEWVLVAGERRLEAHKMLNLKSIRAFVREDLKDNKEKAWSATVSENICRTPLTAEEAFRSIEKAKNELNMSIEDIAENLKITRQRVYQVHGTSNIPGDLLNTLQENKKFTKRHIDAFKLLLGRVKLDSYLPSDEDNGYIREIKQSIKELLDEVINDDLKGEDAIKQAKTIKYPDKSKSFLTNIHRNLYDALRKKPQVSDKKRILTIKQSQKMINMLQEYIEEQERILAEKSKPKTEALDET
jgi:ParB/RepB/Spo0J family partition protein